MSEKKIIIILLDAFRADYLDKDETPFLYSLGIRHGVRKIRPSYGFCERTEILHGKDFSESGLFTAISLKKEPSIHRRNILRIWPRMKSNAFSVIVRKILNKFALIFQIKLPIYLIPLELLGLWNYTEDSRDITDPFLYNSGFLYENRHRKFSFNHFTALGKRSLIKDEKTRLHAAIAEVEDNDVVFVYLGESDWLGHVYGPESGDFKSYLSRLDANLAEAYHSYNHDEVETIFLGDHGMVQVERYVDIEKILLAELAQHGLRRNINYFLFIDSTIVRVYFLNNSTLDPMLIKSFCEKHELNFVKNIGKEYGDIILGCNAGVMFYPNYFNSQKLKGMHGYRDDITENLGMIIRDDGYYSTEVVSLHEALT